MNCLIASALLGGTVWTMVASDKSTMRDYVKTFTEEQKAIQNVLSMARLKIWIMGMVLGIVVAFMSVRKMSGDRRKRACLFAMIAMVVNYFFYMLWPKPGHMIEFLRKDQVDEWLAVRNMMQRNYHYGLLGGAAGLVLLGYVL